MDWQRAQIAKLKSDAYWRETEEERQYAEDLLRYEREGIAQMLRHAARPSRYGESPTGYLWRLLAMGVTVRVVDGVVVLGGNPHGVASIKMSGLLTRAGGDFADYVAARSRPAPWEEGGMQREDFDPAALEALPAEDEVTEEEGEARETAALLAEGGMDYMEALVKSRRDIRIRQEHYRRSRV